MNSSDFRSAGHALIDQLASFLDVMPGGRVTSGPTPAKIRELLGSNDLPEAHEAGPLLAETTDLLIENSLFNGHPKFWGYITSSAAPLGALADLIAATMNPNVGGAILSPMASEIETQTVRWLSEMLGFPTTAGGTLVSGGNMANFVCFLAGRQAKAQWDIKEEGVVQDGKRMIAYASTETHTWIEKAAELFGQGHKSVRMIKTDEHQRMRMDDLRRQVDIDRADGHIPFLVVGAAGTVGTGVVDPLPEIASFCKEHDMWFHVDGAYGAPAVLAHGAPSELRAMSEADSIAMDPHKWLYSPLEAGCALVRNPQHLLDTFSHHPTYYQFDGSSDDPTINYHEYGLQNSRGFRALKVWLSIKHIGVGGFREMIEDDFRLSQEMYAAADAHPEFEAFTQHLSIATFRYVPAEMDSSAAENNDYLNALNEKIVERLQAEGELFVSNAVINDQYVMRACIVNFRTETSDVVEMPEIVARVGREVHANRL